MKKRHITMLFLSVFGMSFCFGGEEESGTPEMRNIKTLVGQYEVYDHHRGATYITGAFADRPDFNVEFPGFGLQWKRNPHGNAFPLKMIVGHQYTVVYDANRVYGDGREWLALTTGSLIRVTDNTPDVPGDAPRGMAALQRAYGTPRQGLPADFGEIKMALDASGPDTVEAVVERLNKFRAGYEGDFLADLLGAWGRPDSVSRRRGKKDSFLYLIRSEALVKTQESDNVTEKKFTVLRVELDANWEKAEAISLDTYATTTVHRNPYNLPLEALPESHRPVVTPPDAPPAVAP